MKRLLFIAYFFPPVGGAGVQRSTKFVKYLPQSGWLPSVLTVKNPSVPAWDESLLQDIPGSVVVRRARTWEPGYAAKAAVSQATATGTGRRTLIGMAKSLTYRMARFALQPDPQVLWTLGAIREGTKLLREFRHDAIMVSAPPFSTFLVGAVLSQRSGLPLVLDYRDEWDISNAYWENRKPDAISTFLQSRMQAWLIRRASVLIATTRASSQALDAKRRQVKSSAKVACIYNGFDPGDIATPPAEIGHRRNGRVRVAYVGTLWNLTSVEPLVSAVERLSADSPQLAARLELIFAGRRTDGQQQLLNRLRRLPCKLEEHPYLDHTAAVSLLRSSDLLCILLSDVAGAERVVPAKLFECMAVRKPILAICPCGETWELLNDYPARHLATPRDIDSIAGFLRDLLLRQVDDRAQFAAWDPLRFSRPYQAAELAAILDSIG